MGTTIRLTMAQALVRYLAAQRIEIDGTVQPYFAGVFAIFGHGNVAGIGEALGSSDPALPVYRAHNEQAMAHAAIAFAKAKARRQVMACTTSIGPGATNMVTAAALAHVNRLPVLLLPGDIFASRRPDPVLQQIENFSEPLVSANDAFRPVSRFFDRIMRPEQLLASLPQAMSVLLDPADCGPVVMALPQDVQAEAWDYPLAFFAEQVRTIRRPRPDRDVITQAAAWLDAAERPLIVAGGGVHYSGAQQFLADFAERNDIPVAETQAGKGALAWDHPCNVGAIGVTGSSAANRAARDADLVIALGTRLQDFTTASNTLFNPGARVLAVNAARHDAIKAGALAVQADALAALQELDKLCRSAAATSDWHAANTQAIAEWQAAVDAAVAPGNALPSDAQVLGAVNRVATDATTVVCAAGGLPGELHKLWRASGPGAYHLEYGYSCMGYEIAGLGVKMACPEREVIVLVGDGSYLMMNSEIASSIMLGHKLTIVLLDNRGFGCIERLQASCGGESFNNLLSSQARAPAIDFAAHAAALGARSTKVTTLGELAEQVVAARAAERTSVIVIDTDPAQSTAAGGAWWDVPVAEVSSRPAVRAAHAAYRRERDELNVRLGINPLTWTNDDLPALGDETPLETCLSEAAAVGYDGVELGRKFPRDPAVLGPILEAHGLSLVSGWYSLRLLERDVDAEIQAMQPHFDLLQALGCTVMVCAEVTGCIHGDLQARLSSRPRLAKQAFATFAGRIDELAQHMLERGMRLVYHHHMGTVVQSAEEVDALLAATSDAVGLLLDTGHLTFAGGDPLAVAKQHVGRIAHVHCKDVRGAVLDRVLNADTSFLEAVLQGAFTVPGDGAIDYPPIFDVLRKSGYSGWLVVEAEQDPAIADPLTYATLGYKNLESLRSG